MALNAAQISAAWQRWVASSITGATPCQFTRTDLEAAVNAIDAWCTTNATSFNNALPAAFKTNATAAQKAALLAVVCIARYGGGI